MFNYGFDVIHPLRELQDLLQYENGVLAKVREKFQTGETETDLIVTVFDASLPKDAYYFRRFTVIVASDLKKAVQQAMLLNGMLDIFNVYLPGYVVNWHAGGHTQIYTDQEVERVRQEYLIKQNYCAELAIKKWTPPLEGTRFCAYCLIQIDHDRVKKCGGCNKRAYCSKDCQRIDWKSDDGGQNHKYWCKLGACEEGVDWEVVQVSGKGLGIVAKTFIPKDTRVIVETDRSKTHPRIIDLMPIKGTMLEKVHLNCISLGDNIPGLGIRTSRLNHACGPNTDRLFDKKLKAIIVISDRDIKPDEEITTNYNGRFENERDPACIERLAQKWGITCTSECVCNDPKRIEEIKEYNTLDDFLRKFVLAEGFDFPKRELDRYFELQDTLEGFADRKRRSLMMASVLAYRSNKKDKSGFLSYKDQARSLALSMTGPEGEYL